jgi:alkaline phosphatase D
MVSVWALVVSAIACGSPRPPVAKTSDAYELVATTHGPLVAEVRSDDAVIWARAERAATLYALVEGAGRSHLLSTAVSDSDDFAGAMRAGPLEPATAYTVRVWFANEGPPKPPLDARSATFVTARAADDRAGFRFAWGGDLAGQNVCRDAREGFPIFAAFDELDVAFFVGLGDMIYADNTCTETGWYGNAQIAGAFGPSTDLEGYRAHWRYSREDPGFARLLASAGYYAVWDDHEVIDNFGPGDDLGRAAPYDPSQHLMPIALDAFREYNPIEGAREGRFYRSVRWGRHVELFFLDTRRYRSARDGAHESMLGDAQRGWLSDAVRASDATWSIVISSVPISVPTGGDSWADAGDRTGYEGEMAALLELFRAAGRHNVLFLTTDVHFAAAFRYTPFPEHPEFRVHEAISGPLHAGLFPNQAFDPSFGAERLFWFGAPSIEGLRWEVARTFMNFGTVEVAGDGALEVAIRNERAEVLHSIRLEPAD